MKPRNLLTVIISTMLLMAPCSFAQQSRKPQADVHQLANRVRKVIKLVEDNRSIACETRNHLVKRLRYLDDALEAGNRSSARALVIAWSGEARSYQQAGLLSAAHGAILHNGLQGFVDEIGEGWPKKPGPTRKWDPLPACPADGNSETLASASVPILAAVASESPCPVLPPEGSWDSEDTLIVLKSFLHEVPEVGGLLAGLLEILWPSNESEHIGAIIDRALDCTTQQNAANALIALRGGLSPNDGYFWHKQAWLTDCGLIGVPSDQWAAKIAISSPTCKDATQNIYGAWDDMRGTFVGSRILFQTTNEDYQLKLLPVFAQYETLYMSFLREGALMTPAWLASGEVGELDATTPAHIMEQELNPDYVDSTSPLVDPETGLQAPNRGIAYANSIYERHLKTFPQPTGEHKWSKWINRNAYIREMTLNVLDFRDTWKFMDPAAYPKGVEGGVKLTRMIYSDPIGHKRDDDFASFQPPTNVAGPLKELTVFSQRATTGDLKLNYGSWYAISALQSTNPPTAGPARSGEITGDATHDGTTMTEYLDLRVNGPISEVRTWRDRRDDIYDARYLPSAINFKLAATGRWIHTGGGGFPIPVEDNPDALVQIPWKYPGHVLASAKAMGIYTDFGHDTQTTDSVILGFRFYDSFFPSGALVAVGNGNCLNVALTSGASPNVAACSGGQGQIWTYDTNVKAVTIGGGQFCLKAAGTTVGSAVMLDACTGAKNQQWEFVPNATGLNGMIKSVESGLVLTATVVNLTSTITLRSPIGFITDNQYQRWTVTSPLQGEVHAIGSGRCLDVLNDGTAEGTPVQIYDCHGGAAQEWTYNESTQTLSVHNGADCLGVISGNVGTQLQILKCAGERGHQPWVLNRDRTITHVPTGYVIDTASGSRSNGARLVLASPDTSRTSQQWSRPSRRGGNVHATYAGKCLDVPNLFSGTQAQITDCLASPAPGQEWTYHPLTHRITAHGDGTEHCLSNSGSAVVVTGCADDPNQLWNLQDNGVGGTIVNASSGLCMTWSGTTVNAQACPAAGQPANPNQQWIWP